MDAEREARRVSGGVALTLRLGLPSVVCIEIDRKFRSKVVQRKFFKRTSRLAWELGARRRHGRGCMKLPYSRESYTSSRQF